MPHFLTFKLLTKSRVLQANMGKANPLEICPKYFHHTKYRQKATKSSVLRKIGIFVHWDSPTGEYQPYSLGVQPRDFYIFFITTSLIHSLLIIECRDYSQELQQLP